MQEVVADLQEETESKAAPQSTACLRDQAKLPVALGETKS